MRLLTVSEAKVMQCVPQWYKKPAGMKFRPFCKALGNGWNVNVIKHIFSHLRGFNRPLRVLSLFDGISCGLMAFKELNIPIEWYLASEIDKHPLDISRYNFPEIIQLGDVCNLDVNEIISKYGVPDIIIGGSPCKNLSFSGKKEGLSTIEGDEVLNVENYLKLKSEGTVFAGQSFLFWEYIRILEELKKINPDILFLLENVRMSKAWEAVFNKAIGYTGNHIDARLVSPQSRYRIYWTNINGGTIPQPENTHANNEKVLECPFDETEDEYIYLDEEHLKKAIINTPEDMFDDICKRVIEFGGRAISFPSTRAGIKVTRMPSEKSMALISTCTDTIGKFEDKPRIIEIEKI